MRLPVRISANRNSLYASRALNRDVTARPGRTAGSTIIQNACQRLQPSIIAASSSSIGTSTKKLRISQMVKGWLIATMDRIIIQYESIIPNPRAITKNGIASKIWGNMRIASNPNSNFPECLDFIRASP